MRLALASCFCLLVSSASGADIDELFDRLDATLTVAAFNDNFRARLSGTVDLEFYNFQQPAPALIDSSNNNLFNPRLTLFLDAQAGSQIYFFAQARFDRGFDPGDRSAQVRLEEYALRITPWPDGRLTLQLGKFATVVGNWVPRHLSWDNPFVDAPLVYESLTAISDKAAPFPPSAFLSTKDRAEKYSFNPVIWGPSYSTGVSVSGRVGTLDYAAELKNASLSSRPESWSATEVGFDHPTFSGRLGFRPNQMWNFGFSISDGPYLRSEAQSTLPAGRNIGDYRELLLGQDASFAWHHLQVWAEVYEARFEVPRVGDADTLAYYLEAKYKFTPQFFGAIRWNQQLFSNVNIDRRGSVQWGEDLGRIDVAAGYRFTSHTQLKVQYSFQQQTSGRHDSNHLFAAQFTVRF